MFFRRYLVSLTALIVLSISGLQAIQAADGLRAGITNTPTSTRVGSDFRARCAVKNTSSEPVRAKLAIWIIRPWGDFHELGSTVVELPAGETRRVEIACHVNRDVPVGPHALGLVVSSAGGRFIADSAGIRVFPGIAKPPQAEDPLVLAKR